MTASFATPTSGLPDPDYEAEFYADVPAKRLMAWVIDVLLISLLVGLATMLGFFLPLLFLPFLFFCVSFLYRWTTIASGSATPGMRIMAIELRNIHGRKLDGGQAFLHTAGYAFSVLTVPLQLVSIVMMLSTARGQGLTDTVLGTTAINRRAR